VNLGPNINSSAADHCPLPTPDGRTLIFVSNRPGGFGGNDFYISHRHDKSEDPEGWGPAENLGSAVNSEFTDFTPGYFRHCEDDDRGRHHADDEHEGDGDENEENDEDQACLATFYFASNRPGGPGAEDIYASTVSDDWTFSPPVLVPELSTPLADTFPVPRRDGLELVLTSNRVGTLGGTDLWVSTRASTSDPWSTPVNLGPIVNSTVTDGRGVISWDKKSLYLYSNRPGTVGGTDLWVSMRSKLKGKKNE
jgi:hypothetical protein